MGAPKTSKLVGRIVLAEWLDSGRSDGWHRDDPLEQAHACRSAGLLIAATRDVVTIAGHWTIEADRQRCGEMTIPTRALVSLRALE